MENSRSINECATCNRGECLGEGAKFIRTAPATFSMKPSKPKETKEKIKELIQQEKKKVSGGYIGKAGEHFVASELLFSGYNASIMSVDVGMDVIATKENQLFSLQVKTANISSTNTFE